MIEWRASTRGQSILAHCVLSQCPLVEDIAKQYASDVEDQALYQDDDLDVFATLGANTFMQNDLIHVWAQYLIKIMNCK